MKVINMDYFITEDNTKIYFNMVGEGTPIIFVHGYGANHDVFRVPQKILGKDNKVITYDLRGHGLSRNSKDRITIELLAFDLKELIDYLNLNNVILAGWSLGGSIILEYIKLFGNHKVDKLCLLDTSPRVINDQEWRLGLYRGEYNMISAKMDLGDMDINWDKYSEKFMKKLAPELSESQLRIGIIGMKDNNILSMIQVWESLITKDYNDILKNINIPTLIIFGGKSSLYSNEVGEFLNKNIENSELVFFEDNSHLLVQENPTKISRVIKDFISK